MIITKSNLIIFLLITILILNSCENELKTILEPDFKVIQIDYGFGNYMENVKEKAEPLMIKQRNLVIIDVSNNGQITIEGVIIKSSSINSELIKYITPSPENEKMPMTIVTEFEFAGKVTMNKNLVIMAKYNKGLSFEKYREIRNKIYLSFNSVRNKFSIEKYDKTLLELINSNEEVDKIKWREITNIIPIRYTEFVE